MASLFCLYRKHWFLSWIIVGIILTIILNALNIDYSTQVYVSISYFIIHILIFMFGIQKEECFQEKLKEDAERIRRYGQMAQLI